MKVVNRQAQETYDAELVRLEQQYNDSVEELHKRKPVPIKLKKHESDEILERGKHLTMPGHYYGEDEQGKPLALHPDEIGPDDFWIEVDDK